MKRRLLNLLTALSLLLCVATCVLWVRSYWLTTQARFYSVVTAPTPIIRRESFASDCGRIGWVRFDMIIKAVDVPILQLSASRHPHDLRETPAKPNSKRTWVYRHVSTMTATEARNDVQLLGFRVQKYRTTQGGIAGSQFDLWLPYWFVALLFALLPSLMAYHCVIPPYASGMCPRCGYDLRATPGRCPECGHAAAGATT